MGPPPEPGCLLRGEFFKTGKILPPAFILIALDTESLQRFHVIELQHLLYLVEPFFTTEPGGDKTCSYPRARRDHSDVQDRVSARGQILDYFGRTVKSEE